MAPTRIYVPLLRPLLARGGAIHALAHITGGGITENLPRVLRPGQGAQVRTQAWTRPPVFDWIQTQGGVPEDEMLHTFNCGVGMVAIVDAGQTEAVLSHCRDHGVPAWDIGQVVPGSDRPAVSYA